MKVINKLILLISLIAFSIAPSFAACDYINRCPASNSNISSSASQFLSNATGSTFFAEQFAQNIIASELKKATGQNFEVTLKAFSIEDLLKGVFKSLTITGNNIVVQGFHFSSIKIQTMCGFNSVDINSKPIKIRENMVLDFTVELSGSDIKNTVEYGDYLNIINKADLSSIGIISFKLLPSTISVENNKLYFTINATPHPPYKPLDISISADIKVQDERLVSSKIEFINLYTGFELSQYTDLINSLNNLIFPISIFGNDKSEVQIKNINIVGSKIFINGMVFIPKN